LPRPISFICHSYENCRGVGVFFPNWNRASEKDASPACAQQVAHPESRMLLRDEGSLHPAHVLRKSSRNEKSVTASPLEATLMRMLISVHFKGFIGNLNPLDATLTKNQGEGAAEEVAVTLEEATVEVWRQALAEGARDVELGGEKFPVRETPRKRLREVDFVFEGQPLRGLEQNPRTESRWAELARAGHKVMQFLSAGRYIGVVVDGKVTLYGGKKASNSVSRKETRA
jgi:hypothetical protein